MQSEADCLLTSRGRASLGERDRGRVRPVQHPVGDHLVHGLRRVRAVPGPVRGRVLADGAPWRAARHRLVPTASPQSVCEPCNASSNHLVSYWSVMGFHFNRLMSHAWPTGRRRKLRYPGLTTLWIILAKLSSVLGPKVQLVSTGHCCIACEPMHDGLVGVCWLV